MTNRKLHNYGLSIDTKMDDVGLLLGQILLEFRDIFSVSAAITAKRMKTQTGIVSDVIVIKCTF